MRPLLCVATCEEIVGQSPFPAATVAIAFIIGTIVVVVSVKRGRTP
ncbi:MULTISPECIES: hypothetical protein [unclassified Methanoculleus]|nr:hypothetical protein [Methanoculleus sp. UBA377]